MNKKIISKGLAHFFVKRFMGPFLYRRAWLKKTERYDKKQLEELQLHLLKKLIHHCYTTVPFYRELMDKKNITPKDINSLNDINKFPVLSKKDVLAAGNSIVSKKYPKWLTTTGLTGGTTGTPLYLPRNIFAVGNEHAFVRRQWDWANIGFTDNVAFLSGRVVVDPDQSGSKLYAYDPFMRELVLSTYHLSSENAKFYLNVMQKYNVKAIAGYTSAISYLGRISMDLGIKLKLKSALTTSETINDTMRNIISNAFGCQVFDFYGAAERVCYIYTCPEGSYHIIPEYGLTEKFPVKGRFENEYKIISTGFWNWAMPLIRYDTGDVIKKSNNNCACGRCFEVVDSIIGRTGDLIKTPSGKVYGPTLLARIAKGAKNILASQIIQEKIDQLRIEYVPGKDFSQKDLAFLKSHIAKHLSSELKIDYFQVKEIKKTKSGKMQHLVSKL